LDGGSKVQLFSLAIAAEVELTGLHFTNGFTPDGNLGGGGAIEKLWLAQRHRRKPATSRRCGTRLRDDYSRQLSLVAVNGSLWSNYLAHLRRGADRSPAPGGGRC
jgi:hypothetical protein